MTAIVSAKFVPTALAAAAIGLGALMAVGAPTAHASEKSDCEGKGGKDTATNTTSCTSTTVTKNSRIPVTVRPGVIDTAETIEPAAPVQRIPVDVLNTDAQIQQTP
jgi:hypothetical protein